MEPRFDLTGNELGAKIGKRFANTSLLILQSTLPKSTMELVELRASQINGCGFCVDAHAKELAAAGEPAVRINLAATWRESTVFTEAERVALAFAEEGTRLADAHTGVSDATWAGVREHYDDDQIAALVYLVAMINAANRLGVIVRRIVLNVFATVSVSLVIGFQPMIAAAAPAGIPVEPAAPTTRIETTTAPFDPICPLCFLREFLESNS